MKSFSNRYIFGYITLLVVVIALLLSAVAIGLKPRREANKKIEKAQQILYAAGYGKISKSVASEQFRQVATHCNIGDREAYKIRCANGQNGVVVLVSGKGLWGPIWGYIILSEDYTTIIGSVFSHQSETPGLGDKITTEAFSKSFIGKHIVDGNGRFVSVRVLQKGKDNNISDNHRVDAITGATLTSKGVDRMLYDDLKDIYSQSISK